MVTLPGTAWRHRAGIDTLVAALGDARFVGGCVRDALLGIEPADIDLATPLEPEDVIDRLRAARIKPVPTGLAHGTITAVLESGPVEVTTLRRDVSTDGRHAVVAYTADWQADAARRDFTMNALYADPSTGEVFDWFGGLDDLAARRVRFIGDPLQRIAEDHLRILRFFRFLARFGDTPDADGLAACAARANDLMALSRERIRDELLKLLVAKDAVRVVRLMLDNGIFVPVLPEIISADRLATLAAREAESAIAPDPLRRLAALIPADAAEIIGARLKLSNVERKRLMLAVQPANDTGTFELGYRAGIVGAVDRLLLSDRPVDQVRQIAGWTRPTLPISGGELVARGMNKGPEVARTLHAIEDRWIAENFPGTARVREIADAEVAQALRSANSE